ncbi:MAG: hypothetical protein OSA99_02685 [Acidimicrobiales bacterium]|nr:hypothetical protein [Acidimicrobiales bacterium]
MVIAVRTERGPDGLEVVKEAETDADRARLAAEATILRRGAHPGVAEVVDATESVLRLRHCGSPVARLGPVAPDHAAAIVRSVAEVVDALHRQGIVHRRIDADHVVVSERGRPSLVGFGDAGDGDADAKADDVAALGAMLNRLLDDGSEALWSPAHRGVRAATRRKRAMSAFRTAAAAASRPDPGQRPTAHQFATAVADALPGLTLPTPPGVDPDRPDPGGPGIPDDIDPTAELGWSDFDLSFLAIDDQVAPDDEVERNPAAPRDPYAVLESLASPEPTDDASSEPPVTGTEPEPTTEPELVAEPEPEPTTESESKPEPEPEPEPLEDPIDPIIEAMRAALESERESPLSPAPPPGVDAASAPASDPEPAPESGPVPTTVQGLDPVDTPFAPAPEPPHPPTIQIRPGSTETETSERSGPSRRLLVAVAAVVLIIGAIAGSVIARAVDPFGAESAAASPDDETTDGTPDEDAPDEDAAPDTPPPLPDDCDSVERRGPQGEDGCPLPVSLEGRTATVGDTAVELGQDGDLVVVADSDCDGIATPVLLRPSTGEVFDFPGWSLDEAIEVVATDSVDGAVSIEATDDPCPEVVVIDESGVETVVAP